MDSDVLVQYEGEVDANHRMCGFGRASCIQKCNDNFYRGTFVDNNFDGICKLFAGYIPTM